jgi:hypothetical protein
MTLHDNIMVTALEKSSLAWGADPNRPNEEGVLIWDVSDPINPRQLSHWKTGSTGTHRNSYPGGRYVYLSAAGLSAVAATFVAAALWAVASEVMDDPTGCRRRCQLDESRRGV